MPTADREGLGPAETKALADELMTYAAQLIRAETQAGMGGKDLAVRVKEPGELAHLMVRAASGLQARGYATAQADVARISAEVEALRKARDEAVSHLPEGLRGTSLAGAVQALAFSARTENDSKWRWGHALTIGLAFADKAAGEEWEHGGMASIDVCHALAATLGCECDSDEWAEMAKAGAVRLAEHLALSRTDKADSRERGE